MSASDIHFFLQLRDQIKLYHWQTRVYARHTATDKVLGDLERIIDSYVEIYIGKYGRKRLVGADAKISLNNLTEVGATRFINSSIRYCQGGLVKGLSKVHDTDLFNLKDELVGALNQLLYLFTLH
jgi:hypothetical protein